MFTSEVEYISNLELKLGLLFFIVHACLVVQKILFSPKAITRKAMYIDTAIHYPTCCLESSLNLLSINHKLTLTKANPLQWCIRDWYLHRLAKASLMGSTTWGSWLATLLLIITERLNMISLITADTVEILSSNHTLWCARTFVATHTMLSHWKLPASHIEVSEAIMNSSQRLCTCYNVESYPYKHHNQALVDGHKALTIWCSAKSD